VTGKQKHPCKTLDQSFEFIESHPEMSPEELMRAIPCSKDRLVALMACINKHPYTCEHGRYLERKYKR